MKTTRLLIRSITAAGIALAVLAFVPMLATTQAQQKGAERLLHLQKIRTLEDLQTVEPGDILLMSCPKCKTTTAAVVEKTFKTAKPEELKNVTLHLCPGCDTKLVTHGQGKQAQNALVHTCKACGSKDVFCCVLKKDSKPTPGMEKTE